MKHLTALTLFVCLAGLSPAAPPKGLDRELLQPAVAVTTHESLGSGTLILLDHELYVLTAAHVVEDCMQPRKVEYTDEEGNTIEVEEKTPLPVQITSRRGASRSTRSTRIVWYDPKNDLALLKVDDPRGLAHAEIYTGKVLPSPGETAWYCGSGGGLYFSLCRTIVNQLTRGWVIVNGTGWYGHSGSGLFLQRGGKLVLVGVLTELDHLGDPRTPVKCVDLARIRPFLARYLASKKKKAKPDLPAPKEVKP